MITPAGNIIDRGHWSLNIHYKRTKPLQQLWCVLNSPTCSNNTLRWMPWRTVQGQMVPSRNLTQTRPHRFSFCPTFIRQPTPCVDEMVVYLRDTVSCRTWLLLFPNISVKSSDMLDWNSPWPILQYWTMLFECKLFLHDRTFFEISPYWFVSTAKSLFLSLLFCF